MTSRWLFILLVPVALLVAWIGISYDSREQTVFLERIAEGIEHAQAIPPETDHAIKKTLASIRRRASSTDERLEIRQKLAIERIEAGLASKVSARTGSVVSRETGSIVSREMPRREMPAE